MIRTRKIRFRRFADRTNPMRTTRRWSAKFASASRRGLSAPVTISNQSFPIMCNSGIYFLTGFPNENLKSKLCRTGTLCEAMVTGTNSPRRDALANLALNLRVVRIRFVISANHQNLIFRIVSSESDYAHMYYIQEAILLRLQRQ